MGSLVIVIQYNQIIPVEIFEWESKNQANLKKKKGNFYDQYYVLTEREKRAAKYASKLYRTKFRRDPEKADNLFIHLGDNPWKFLCWSGVSGRLPTFRTSSGKLWNPKRKVFLTPKDKLAALGLPVTPQVALAMGLPVLPIADSLRASAVAGNSFHFSCSTVVQLVALGCYRLAH